MDGIAIHLTPSGALCPVQRCGNTFVPARAICPLCQSEELDWVETSGTGRLSAFTVIYSGPTFMLEQGFNRKNPYVSGIDELEKGPRVGPRVPGIDPTKPAEIQIGTPLSLNFVEVEEDDSKKVYLAFKAVPS